MASRYEFLLVNETTGGIVTDQHCELMAEAINQLLPTFCNDWRLQTPTVRYVGNGPALKAMVPPFDHRNQFVFYLINTDSTSPDALAYHTSSNAGAGDESDAIVGKVLCKTILDNGGAVLYTDLTTDTIASATYHECIEALADPQCVYFADDFDGHFYCLEVADPVQANIVPVTTASGVIVGLSDWVLPAWFASDASTSARFSHNGTLHAPFTLDKGGYYSVLDAASSSIRQVFGNSVPQWKRDLKAASHRFTDRATSVTVAPKAPVAPVVITVGGSRPDTIQRGGAKQPNAKAPTKTNVPPPSLKINMVGHLIGKQARQRANGKAQPPPGKYTVPRGFSSLPPPPGRNIFRPALIAVLQPSAQRVIVRRK